MQFRLMRNFIVVAEELHMHRAAERLNMAQPALSQQIKTLEDRLGVMLFSRANRRLTLTPDGEAFLSKARVAILMTDQAILDARQTARGEQGVLNLGCVSSAIFDSKLPAALTLASVKEEKWIALRDPEGMGLEQYFYDACHSAGIQPDVVQNATDVPTVISLVSAGFGIAMLPASAKAICVQNVVFVDILDRLRESELTLVCHRIIRPEVLKKLMSILDHT